MKKWPFLFCLSLLHCTTPRSLASDPAILRSYTPPFSIFQIGDWPPDYQLLTLVDAKGQYIHFMIRRDERLKTGDRYEPRSATTKN